MQPSALGPPELSAPERGTPGLGRHYGWVMVVVAALAMAATLPGRSHGLGLFTKAILHDFEIDQVLFTSFNLWATLLGALFCFPFGWLFDRFGARPVLTLVLLALSAAVIGMSYLGGTDRYALAGLFLLITLTRGLGQSALSLVSLTMVGKWFVRRLNVAMGVYSFLVSIFFIVAFGVLKWVLPLVEWREAWSGIGISIAIFAPAAWLFVREPAGVNRQDPEGEPTPPGRAAGAAAGYRLDQALASPVFWIFSLASSLFLLVSTGVSLLNELILVDQLGFNADVYRTSLIVGVPAGLCGNLLGGAFTSAQRFRFSIAGVPFGALIPTRWPIGRVMGLAMFLLAIALLAMPGLALQWQVYVQASVMGFAGGLITFVFFAFWAYAYGRLHLGRIQGTAQMFTVIASAVGPLCFALCYRWTSSYNAMFFGLSAVVLLFGLAAWLVPLPRPIEQTLGDAGDSAGT